MSRLSTVKQFLSRPREVHALVQGFINYLRFGDYQDDPERTYKEFGEIIAFLFLVFLGTLL